jgi:hypothetical protein
MYQLNIVDNKLGHGRSTNLKECCKFNLFGDDCNLNSTLVASPNNKRRSLVCGPYAIGVRRPPAAIRKDGFLQENVGWMKGIGAENQGL